MDAQYIISSWEEGTKLHRGLFTGVAQSAMGYGLAGFLSAVASRPALGPTQHLIQWLPGALPEGFMQLSRNAYQSPPSGAEVKNGGAIPPLPRTFYWRGA
jgi:hypothetical protein